jgi:cadmium resistance protein CadD (predicted permease)
MESHLAIIGLFFMPILMVIAIIWIKSNSKNKQNQLQAEVYAKAIEHGQELPANFFETLPKEQKKRANPLNIGIILIAVGVGISLFFAVIAWVGVKESMQGAPIGIIPFFIGIGYLLIHFIGKKQAAKNDAE